MKGCAKSCCNKGNKGGKGDDGDDDNRPSSPALSDASCTSFESRGSVSTGGGYHGVAGRMSP